VVFAFFVTSQLEMLRTLDGNLLTAFALGAFKTKYQLLDGLCLLLQDGFGLNSEILLFAKGQLISECLFDNLKFSKKTTKNVTNFCPSISKVIKATKLKHLLILFNII